MTRMMAIVGVLTLCALGTGCSSSSASRVGSGADALKWRHRSVAEKFAEFAKQGWTVTGGGIKKPETIAGTNGMIYKRNPYDSGKANPLNNAVWSTNFRVDKHNAEKVQGVNIVKSDGAGAVNMIQGSGNNGVNVVGPGGSAMNGSVPRQGNGNIEIKGPAGTGSANVNTTNGLPTDGTVSVMGPDGKVHTVKRDLSTEAGNLLAPVLKGN